jgi:hypothetical protein
MKKAIFGLAMAALFTGAGAFGQSAVSKAFLGRWDLTVTRPDGEHASWIEIKETDGKLSAEFVGRWGNARALPSIEIQGKHVKFVSPAAEEGRKTDMVFDGTLSGGKLEGSTTGPDGTPWKWVGVRAPALKRTKAPEWGEPIHLFNGKDLAGWKPSRAGGPDWTVADGMMVKPPQSPEMITEQKFQDFKLHVEFNCGPEANSGVYLRGRYEVQVETQSEAAPPNRHMGAIYGFIAPEPMQPRTAGAWQTYDVTLIGRRVTVVQNGITIIKDKEIPGITGGALDSHEADPGPIYLQGGEDGRVQFRNIVITPAK